MRIRDCSECVRPGCFPAEFPLRKAIQRKDVGVERMPFELRPEEMEITSVPTLVVGEHVILGLARRELPERATAAAAQASGSRG